MSKQASKEKQEIPSGTPQRDLEADFLLNKHVFRTCAYGVAGFGLGVATSLLFFKHKATMSMFFAGAGAGYGLSGFTNDLSNYRRYKMWSQNQNQRLQRSGDAREGLRDFDAFSLNQFAQTQRRQERSNQQRDDDQRGENRQDRSNQQRDDQRQERSGQQKDDQRHEQRGQQRDDQRHDQRGQQRDDQRGQQKDDQRHDQRGQQKDDQKQDKSAQHKDDQKQQDKSSQNKSGNQDQRKQDGSHDKDANKKPDAHAQQGKQDDKSQQGQQNKQRKQDDKSHQDQQNKQSAQQGKQDDKSQQGQQNKQSAQQGKQDDKSQQGQQKQGKQDDKSHQDQQNKQSAQQGKEQPLNKEAKDKQDIAEQKKGNQEAKDGTKPGHGAGQAQHTTQDKKKKEEDAVHSQSNQGEQHGVDEHQRGERTPSRSDIPPSQKDQTGGHANQGVNQQQVHRGSPDNDKTGKSPGPGNVQKDDKGKGPNQALEGKVDLKGQNLQTFQSNPNTPGKGGLTHELKKDSQENRNRAAEPDLDNQRRQIHGLEQDRRGQSVKEGNNIKVKESSDTKAGVGNYQPGVAEQNTKNQVNAVIE